MRFRIAMSTSCPLAWQGSTTLLPGLGLLPSAGRHASCLSLFCSRSVGAWGSRGPAVEDKERPRECLVWSLGPGVGVTEIFFGVWGLAIPSPPHPMTHSIPLSDQAARENTAVYAHFPPQYALHIFWPMAELGVLVSSLPAEKPAISRPRITARCRAKIVRAAALSSTANHSRYFPPKMFPVM